MLSTKGHIGNIYINKRICAFISSLCKKELPDNSDKLCCGKWTLSSTENTEMLGPMVSVGN